jgi:hypothetical protein
MVDARGAPRTSVGPRRRNLGLRGKLRVAMRCIAAAALVASVHASALWDFVNAVSFGALRAMQALPSRRGRINASPWR